VRTLLLKEFFQILLVVNAEYIVFTVNFPFWVKTHLNMSSLIVLYKKFFPLDCDSVLGFIT
jgi:hypothetical protein